MGEVCASQVWVCTLHNAASSTLRLDKRPILNHQTSVRVRVRVRIGVRVRVRVRVRTRARQATDLK